MEWNELERDGIDTDLCALVRLVFCFLVGSTASGELRAEGRRESSRMSLMSLGRVGVEPERGPRRVQAFRQSDRAP